MMNNLRRKTGSVTERLPRRLILVGLFCATVLGLGMVCAKAQALHRQAANRGRTLATNAPLATANTLFQAAGGAPTVANAGVFSFTSDSYFATDLETERAIVTEKLGTRAPRGAVITVHRTGGVDGRVVVNWTTVDPPDPDALTALPEDYVAESGAVVFDHLQTSQRFIVAVRNNETNDLDKTLLLRLTSAQADSEEDSYNPGLIQPTLGLDEATLNILEVSTGPNNGTNFSIERFSYMVDEAPAEDPTELTSTVVIDVIHPSATGGRVELEVTRFNGWVNAFLPLMAGSDYALADAPRDYPGTLSTDDLGQIRRITNSLDYISQTVTLTFAAGQSRQSVTLTVTNDNEVEFNEDIRVRLNSLGDNEPPLGANSTANVTILFEDQPAGALDREWNADLVRTTNPRFNAAPGANGTVRALTLQADDKTVLVGDFTAYNSFSRNGIARANLDGSHDDTFNPGTGADNYIAALAIYPASGSPNNGKIVVGGGFTSFNNIQRNGVARLNPNGELDGTFNPGAGANGVVRSVAIQSDGKALIAGDFTAFGNVGRKGIARLNANGSLDATFNPGSGADGSVWSVSVLETGDRKIYIAGEFLDYNGTYRGNVARLNDDGSLDTNFDPGGGPDGPAYTVAAQSDGSVLIGGYFASVDFNERNNIARFLADGSLDSSFDPGSGANDAVYAITPQADGKIMVGGVFTVFNGTRRLGLTRLFANGTVDTGFLDTAYNQFAGLVSAFYFEPPNYVNAVAVQSDGAVLIGGSFSTVGGNWAAEIRDNDINIYKPFERAWTRQQKRPRLNLARLIGGRTPGPGNIGFVFEENPVDEGAGQLVAGLRRSDGQLGRASAEALTTDNLAIGGLDFAATQVPVSWASPYYVTSPRSIGNNRENFLVVPILEDSLIDGNETFRLNLSRPAGTLFLGGEAIQLGTALGRSEANATVVDNDFNRGTFAFSNPVYYTNENSGFLRLTVVRTNGSTGPVSVRYFTRDGTALAGQDFTGVGLGTLTFGQGVTSQTLSIPLSDDFIVEPDETFTVTLTNATGGATIYGGFPNPTIAATVTIIDNDLLSGRASFASTNFDVSESISMAEVLLVRRGGSIGQLSVTVAATGGTAQGGLDFIATTNTLTWVDGDVAPKTFLVTLLDDLEVEGNQSISLRILNAFPSNAIGGVSNATLTVVDDDFPGTVSFSQAIFDADERGTNITIIVTRSGGVGGTVTADYSIVNGTASSPTDFIATSGTLTFGPGVMAASFEVEVVNNGLTDGEREATLTLGNFSPSSSAGLLPSATLRIMDDESVGDPAGSLDTSFSPLAGGTNAIHALALQPDGTLFVAGEFRTLNRIFRNRIGRLNPDGTLDSSFNALGGPNGTVRALALQPDGRVVIGGFFDQVHATNRNHIARLLADGSVDGLFNPGAGADNPVFALAIHLDGRIVMGGSFATVNGISRAGVALLESNGSVSAGFNPGAGADGAVFAVAVQPDGKILVGGDFTTFNGIISPRLVRLNLDGSVDTTFDAGSGPNAPVRAIALQADGKILIGGSFTSVNGTDRGHLARLDSGGGLDTVFLAAAVGGNGDVSAIQLQFDGRIIAVGNFTQFNGVSRNHITRLHRNGKTDPTINFGEGANDSINAAVIQTDRRVVIGGRFTEYDGNARLFLARIHGGSIAGPGSLEFGAPYYSATENSGGATIVVRRRGGTVEDVTVDYLTVAGTATPGLDYTDVTATLTFLEGETKQTFTVPLANDFVGEPDETVGLLLTNQTAGVTLGAVPTATLTIVNDDSGAGLSASSYTVNENNIGGSVMISVLRTGATNGSSTVNYSTSSGTAIGGQDYTSRSGAITFAPGQILQTFTVTITDDALIESAETFSVNLSNLTGGGALNVASATVTIIDNDFSAGSLAFSSLSYSAAESAGSVVVSVIRTNGSTGVLTVNYRTVAETALGGIDYISQSGTLTFPEGETSRSITISILDDSLVEGAENLFVQLSNAGGGAILAGSTNATVIILDEEFGPGSLDRTFETGAGANGLVRSVAAQSDGKIIVSGAFTAFDNINRNYIARLEATGAIDLLFNPGSGADAFVSSVAATPGNHVMLAGAFSSVGGVNFGRVARLNTNGVADPAFNRTSGFNAAVNVMAVQPNGRVLLGGAFSLPTRGIARLQANGSVDNSFSPGLGADGAVHAILVQTDGSVVLGGAFSNLGGEPHSRVGRLSEAGLVDTAFYSGAITNGSVFALAQQSDGKLVVGGDFTTSGGTTRVNLARLNTDGTLDSSFDVGTGANAIVYALGLQSDGKIIVGGDFTSINGTNRNRFARLNSNGSLDDAFDPGRGANNTVYSLVVLPDDNIVVGGDFTEVGGVSRRGVARILGSAVAPAGGISQISAAGGQVQLRLALVPGRTFVLESSSDLILWTPLATNAATSSLWLFSDPSAEARVTRFFRLRQLAP